MPILLTTGVVALACAIALVAADFRAWHRTAGLRRGVAYAVVVPPTSSRAPPDPTASSASTFLAALTGCALVVAGVASSGSSRLGSFACMVGGGFVAATGWLRRVRRVQTSASGIEVTFAHGRGWRSRWEDVWSLRPPRWPVGGWRVTCGTRRPCRLMPTDVLGNEDALLAIVVLGRLRFDGRCWTRAGVT